MNTERISIGYERAVALHDSGWWKELTDFEKAKFQLLTEELCMPFNEFHRAIESALGRPVWTHEFALNYDGLVQELLHDNPAPTMGEINEHQTNSTERSQE